MLVKNLGTIDRLVRAFLAELSLLIAFFWAGRAWQMVLYLLAFVLVFQAATGVCGLYNLIRRNTCERIKRKDRRLVIGALVLMVLVLGAGSYASAIVTKNILKADIVSVEEPYNLTMIITGQNQMNESISQYERLNRSIVAFDSKYSEYRPFVVKSDESFHGDVMNISRIVVSARDNIYAGRLSAAHDILVGVGPILQGIKMHIGMD